MKKSSIYNPNEAQIVMQFCKSLVEKQNYTADNIGIITPYQRQVQHFTELLADWYIKKLIFTISNKLMHATKLLKN